MLSLPFTVLFSAQLATLTEIHALWHEAISLSWIEPWGFVQAPYCCDCRNMTAEIWPVRYDCRDMTTELWRPMLLFTTLGVLNAKLTLRSSQDSSLGLMNTSQTLWATGAPTLEQRMDLKKQLKSSLVPRPPNLPILVACSANIRGFTRPST